VNRVLAEEGVERAVIVGHSLGGPVAAQLAVDDRERVAGLGPLRPVDRSRADQDDDVAHPASPLVP